MKKLFEEPTINCVQITSEVITDDNQVPGGDMGVTSTDPFSL